MERLHRRTLVLALALPFLALACAEEEEPQPSGPAMQPAPRPAREPGANVPPVIESIRFEPASPLPGQRVRAVVEASDPDGDPVRLTYEWSSGRAAIGGRSAAISTHGLSKGDRVEVTAIASDGRMESTPVLAQVRLGNRRPRIAFVGLEGDPAEGEELRAVVEAADPDGDLVSLRYEWRVNDVDAGGRGATFWTATLQRGDTVRVLVWASDGETESDPVVSLAWRLDNRAPEIVSRPAGAVGEDGVFRYVVKALDPDGDESLRFRLREAPEGMTVDPLVGEIVWKPVPDQRGRFAVDVAVEDEHGGASAQRFELMVGEGDDASEAAAPAAPAY